ncbi:MAG: hypothetical protein K8S16_00425, partial [Bacteroidales bacterium]|nr:hypothetical protein [Bacteroidales bacterium]
MTFKRFDFLIIVQLLLIAVNNFVIAWTFWEEHLKISMIYFIVILVLQILFLFLCITKQNKEIIRFLESVKYRDELSKLSEKDTQKSHRELRRLLNEIAESYSQVKIEKESEHFYFLNTIKHLNVGLISYDDNGRIELINEAAEKLLEVNHPKNISQLKHLEKDGLHFPDLIPGKPRLVKIRRDDEVLQLSINMTSFCIKNHKVTLVSFQDIRSEIQQEEIEIWQKLIRVLTHEIMNSAGPITSLSATISDTFKEDIIPTKIGEKLYDQIVIGLQAIQKRSRGLAKFVETYRSLTKLPNPLFFEISGMEFINHLNALMQEELDRENISLYTEIRPENLKLTVDEKLFTQVLINLMRNSIPALKGRENKSIQLLVEKLDNNNIVLQVKDNGWGIPKEILE